MWNHRGNLWKRDVGGIHSFARLDDEMDLNTPVFQVSVSEGMTTHRDANNLGPAGPYWWVVTRVASCGLSAKKDELFLHTQHLDWDQVFE
eukprot:12910300-Prorocentrum_lima.AAC.1